jgi:hypothetical protein
MSKKTRKPEKPAKPPKKRKKPQKAPKPAAPAGATGNPLFDNSPGGAADERLPNSIGWKSEAPRIEALKALLPELLAGVEQRGRAQSFYPYLLVRSLASDQGDRPLTIPDIQVESPDIWTAVGDPSATPAIPPDGGRQAALFQPNTIYAHVWNLGRAPIIGVKVEYYWWEAGKDKRLIGIARVDLGPRSSSGCHQLVKCLTAFVPNTDNGTLWVRVSAVGDNVSSLHPWEPHEDRHVTKRHLFV